MLFTMACTKFILICAAPAVLLLAAGAASFASGIAAVEESSPAGFPEDPSAFAEYPVDDDFAEEDALLETASVRDLVPFIRNAFSTGEQSAGGLSLPKEEQIEFLEALQDVERLQDFQAGSDTSATATAAVDKSVAQHEDIHEKNKNLIKSLLTRLVSVATLKNKVNRKSSRIIDLLMTGGKDATADNFFKRLAGFIKDLQKIRKRLVELADKFIQQLQTTITVVDEQWQGNTQQKAAIMNFLETLLRWADAAKQASEKKWRLIQRLYVNEQKEGTPQEAVTEKVTTSDNLRVAKAAQGVGAEGDKNIASTTQIASLGSLFREADVADRIERQLAQTVWHHAAKCAREGLLPLSFVRVLMSEA